MHPRATSTKLTRFSRLHPYPAMIADELAIALCREYVSEGAAVLDPFCGTSRTILAAAEIGARCVGIDVNPLAILLSKAKIADADLELLHRFCSANGIGANLEGAFQLQHGRTVSWYPKRAVQEISSLIRWINSSSVGPDSLLVLAAILSATAREASYCRKDQWKLHRMTLAQRRRHRPSVYEIFKRRLQTYLREASVTKQLQGSCDVRLGDAKELKESLSRGGLPTQYDLVITSPPYGDSKTTVSYGGMSSICLSAVQYIEGLPIGCLAESAIERACLGGDSAPIGKRFKERILKYWASRTQNREQLTRVASYLYDLGRCCKQISQVIKPGGRVIFVVARRMVGGRRVQTDSFLANEFRRLGFSVEKTYSRRIKNKQTPTIIDRNGATRSGNGSRCISTMRTEVVLVFRNDSQ
jgi:site-specific DNA-methyltransferase (cytosine-N4-specific)